MKKFALSITLFLAACASEPSLDVQSVGVAGSIGGARTTARWLQVDTETSQRPDRAELLAKASELQVEAALLESEMTQAEWDGWTESEIQALQAKAAILDQHDDEVFRVWKNS